MNTAPPHGWLILDKPTGLTSAQALGKIKRAFGIKKRGTKIGHAGTLDSDASGILPIAINKATTAIPYLMDKDKDYTFTIQWGAQTTTDDARGDVINTSSVTPTERELDAALHDFRGVINQRPPDFSALKIAGKRASDRKLAGETIALKPRQITVFSLEITDHNVSARTTTLHATVSKGTYIRALARDLGLKTKSYGHIAALRRTRVGPFDLTHAKTLANCEDLGHKGTLLNACALPTEWALDDIPAITVTTDMSHRILSGQKVAIAQLDALEENTVVRIQCDGQLVSLGLKSDGVFKPKQNFLPSAHKSGERQTCDEDTKE